MVTLNVYAGTFADLKLMFDAYSWPNKIRPKIYSVNQVLANVVPDRSMIIQIGISKAVERVSGALANRPVMFCNLAIFAKSPDSAQKMLDDVFNCIFKTNDTDSPAHLWYVSNLFTTIDKIVPAQLFILPIARDPSRPEFYRGNVNLGIYGKA